MMNIRTALACVMIGALTACGGSGGAAQCTIEEQNLFVYDLLRDFYLYYDRVPSNIDPTSYESPEQLLADLRVLPEDRFSSISDAQTFDDFQEGEFIGAGFLIVNNSNGQPVVGLIYNATPASDSDLRRGDRITEVNGVRADGMTSASEFNEAFGPAEIGAPLNLKVVHPGESVETSVSLVKELVRIDSTHVQRVVQTSAGPVGYLVYTNFFANSENALNAAFAEFRQAGVVDLIVDLRYNGGGRVSTASELATLIAGNRSGAFVKLRYNDRYDHLDNSFGFGNSPNSLGLNRVHVITTPRSCSASELLINGLRPYMDVVTVGTNSCGKPVGQNPQEFCGKVISAVNFETLNRDDQGGYFQGIPPDCSSADDLESEFGSDREASYSAAINLIESGVCPSTGSGQLNKQDDDGSPSWRLTEKQARQ